MRRHMVDAGRDREDGVRPRERRTRRLDGDDRGTDPRAEPGRLAGSGGDPLRHGRLGLGAGAGPDAVSSGHVEGLRARRSGQHQRRRPGCGPLPLRGRRRIVGSGAAGCCNPPLQPLVDPPERCGFCLPTSSCPRSSRSSSARGEPRALPETAARGGLDAPPSRGGSVGPGGDRPPSPGSGGDREVPVHETAGARPTRPAEPNGGLSCRTWS
jgi:hypothetical protein